MYLIKKRLGPESKENSEYTTREYNYQINNTRLYNKEYKENIDYLKFVEKWYKKLKFNKTNKNDDTENSELEIEYIYSQKTLNPLTEFQDFLLHNNKDKTFMCDYADITGDIFSLDANIAIGHCVSKCFTMSKGIATQFETRFNNKEKLINQRKNITEVSHLKLNDQWILYLITKNNYYDKPKYSNIFKTLKNTKQFCIENKITTLALPKICTGLDKKQWDIIANMIQKLEFSPYQKTKVTKKVTL